MQPLQLGLGAKFGMTRMAFTAQEFYAAGYSIAEMDAENGFNRASRQAMLEAIMRECPHMARLFWLGYCSHAPLVLMRRGNEFVVLLSQEGSRMGDKFGSFAFCLAVHPAYLEIQRRCPTVTLQAATDDLKGYAQDPHDLCNMFLVAAEALERHAGVRLNTAKSAILLPPSQPAPQLELLPAGSALAGDGALLIGADGHRVELKRDGTVVVGAAVGTDAFISEHLMSIVRQAARKLELLYSLDAQSALLLLSGCLAPALCYHLQVSPPRLALAAAQAWDAAMDAARLRIALDPAMGRAPRVGAALQELSDRKARLPLVRGGLGQTSAVLLSPIAFFAAYAQHAFLEQSSRARRLRAELDSTLEALRTVLPRDTLELLSSVDEIGETKPERKLQRDLTRAAHNLAWVRLLDSVRDERDRRVLAHPTDAFLPFLVAPTSDALVVGSSDYIAGLRFYLLLPQLLRLPSLPVVADPPAEGALDFSYEADACRLCARHFCDRHLNHSHACTRSSKAKIRDRHDMVKVVRAEAVKEAGYSQIRVEPRLSTSNQRRGDVFFVDETRHKHIHYLTDDVVVHPLCPTHMEHGEARDHLHAISQAVREKDKVYKQPLELMRSHASCLAGLRVVKFTACAFTSLGFLDKGTVSFINAAAGFAKQRAIAEARSRPRDDGLPPQRVSARFRFRLRCNLQAAIMRGNGLLAAEVGL
jgi:hypothetical protein